MLCPYGNVVLITGGTSGIGQAAARMLAREGFHVYGASRRGGRREELGDGFIQILTMDVREEDSVKAAVAAVMEAEGAIHVLINAAGIGIAGAVEDCTPEDAHRQMDTSYYGVIRMLNHVLPIMRRQGNGLVINIGSVAGIYSMPFQTLYSSCKYAVEALTEGLRLELMGTGVKAALVDPGDVHTHFTASRHFAPRSAQSAYMEPMSRAVGKMIHDEIRGMPPEDVAKVIRKVMNRKNPPVRSVTKFSYQALVFLKRILSARMVERLIGLLYVKAKAPDPEFWPPEQLKNEN